MAQKDKVKELVGRGLGSYHTKSLQQMDRIEKKNKEQNHKISILTNELDNDYLTKTEEGSVVSLEHSKEGMIYLDELQGNTLVNYCVDGAKELTLNGDIDVEGTNVTLTEGVDNGLVDVMCEGNTLVNLMYKGTNVGGNSETHYIKASLEIRNDFASKIKTSTKYTIIMYNAPEEVNAVYFSGTRTNLEVKPNVFILNTPENKVSNSQFHFYTSNGEIPSDVLSGIKVAILEGDYTDKEIPPYFEGMKSVGECEDNKIEILSQNKNLFNVDELQVANGSLYGYMYLGKNDNYTLSITDKDTSVDMSEVYFGFTKNGKNAEEGYHWLFAHGELASTNITHITHNDFKYFSFFPNNQETLNKIISRFNVQIEEGNSVTTYIEPKLNKKEISLNEPLRGFENGKKDRFVKINNKWFTERNCRMRNSTEFTWQESGRQFENHYCVFVNGLGCKKDSKYLSTSYPYISDAYATYLDASYISNNSNTGYDLITLTIPKSKLTTVDIAGAREYLNNNPFDFMVELATPTYEEITDVELITYLDTTHISNNSTIPCNMKIQNSGYNAIIKPSTQYTVALDTNKSGTIGINLGGAKVTTTNNVATITTPATLTDDSLRLYGKYIKASKVRLLEGDKTNWIPSYFEGMQSSFEDKLQDDGTYKMEILSNNKNLFDVERWYTFIKSKQKGYFEKVMEDGKECIAYRPQGLYQERFMENEFDRNTQYTLSYSIKDTLGRGVGLTIYYTDGSHSSTWSEETSFVTVTKTSDIGKTIKFIGLYYNHSDIGYIDINSISLVKSVTIDEYTPQKSNKIQFSSIEPLRSVENVKDRFVFKDDKLMIERNCGKLLVDETKYSSSSILDNTIRVVTGLVKDCIQDSYALCDKTTCEITWNKDREHMYMSYPNNGAVIFINKHRLNSLDENGVREYFRDNNYKIVYQLVEPTYEEVPFELQKIILEGYENGTLFFDTNIPPTVTTTYAGETPIVKSVRLNKTEVLNNTNDINDNIVPYLMDMDFRVVCLQLEGGIENISMARLFGGTYEMLQRDILSNRYSKEEYKYRLDAYLSANKITNEEYKKLGDMLNE